MIGLLTARLPGWRNRRVVEARGHRSSDIGSILRGAPLQFSLFQLIVQYHSLQIQFRGEGERERERDDKSK